MVKKIFYFTIIILLSFNSFASAQGEFDASLEQKYASNCEFIKSDFKNYIRPNDLKTRLDRVRTYEKIISDQELIYKRLKANNQSRSGLKNTITMQSDNLTSFKQKFELYDSAARTIMYLDCSKDSGRLLTLLVDARSKRIEVSVILNKQKQITADGLIVLSNISSQLGERYDD